jgi:hypothetical protein
MYFIKMAETEESEWGNCALNHDLDHVDLADLDFLLMNEDCFDVEYLGQLGIGDILKELTNLL